MKLSTLGLKFAVLAAGLSLIAVPRLQAQAKGSLSELDIENSELKVTLEKAQADNKQLRDALAETEKTLADMRKNLAEASGEREIFKREASELKLRIEALGLDASSGNSAKLEQRLLTAVSDLRVMAEEKKKLSEALVQLSEAASIYAKSPNADTRLGWKLRRAMRMPPWATPHRMRWKRCPCRPASPMAWRSASRMTLHWS